MVDSDNESVAPAAPPAPVGPPTNVSTYLTLVIKLNQKAKDEVIANGISTFEDFIQMSDKDITGMCDRMRHPGGMIPKGGNGRAANQLVPDKGVNIGYLQELGLRKLRFYIFH